MLRILHAGEELRITSLGGPYHAWTCFEDVADAVERAWPEITYRVVPESKANYTSPAIHPARAQQRPHAAGLRLGPVDTA